MLFLTVQYSGDRNYNPNFKGETLNITVPKVDVTVNVSADSPINVGNVSVVDINVTSKNSEFIVNGIVNVNVNGTMYTVAIVNGKGNLTLYNLANGTYTINVTYAGDDFS